LFPIIPRPISSRIHIRIEISLVKWCWSRFFMTVQVCTISLMIISNTVLLETLWLIISLLIMLIIMSPVISPIIKFNNFTGISKDVP
jgi:hypothetical protein